MTVAMHVQNDIVILLEGIVRQNFWQIWIAVEKLCVKCAPGACFTNDFLPAIQIRWKLRLAVIPLLAIRS